MPNLPLLSEDKRRTAGPPANMNEFIEKIQEGDNGWCLLAPYTTEPGLPFTPATQPPQVKH